MTDEPTPSRARIGAVATLAGAAAILALVVGVGPAPSVFQLAGADEDISGSCDEAEHAADPACQGVVGSEGTSSTVDDSSTSSTVDDTSTSSTVDDSTSTTAGGPTAPADGVRTLDAAGAGTVIYAFDGGGFRLISATPTSGWRVDVEQAAGNEIDLDFRSGSKRVQVDIELEDGQVRERVRFRDDATDERTETVNGAVDDDRGSNSGPGSGSDDDDDDRSGSSHDDDEDDDDDDRSGSSDDDEEDDDSGRDHPEDG